MAVTELAIFVYCIIAFVLIVDASLKHEVIRGRYLSPRRLSAMRWV